MPLILRSVGLQSILFNNELGALKKALQAIACATMFAKNMQRCSRVSVYYGDCSPKRCLSEEIVEEITREFAKYFDFHYTFFDANLGSANGHNHLAKHNDSDMYIIQNPDIIMAPNVIDAFLELAEQDNVGMVEAKQLPIEHPKDYNVNTGETGWATTACALIPRDIFKKLNGFDAQTFFLYCDDVDFSWRVRMHGYKVIFQPAATVFHDKRLSKNGGWQPTSAEVYYSAEAALLLAWKWSRPDLVEKHLNWFIKSSDPNKSKAAKIFLERKKHKNLPQPIDELHQIGLFTDDGYYANHRYQIG